MNVSRRLGRGLEALLGQPFGTTTSENEPGSQASVPHADSQAVPQEAPQFAPAGEAPAGITYINVYEVDSSPYQPRREFDDAEIDALAQSIRDHGLIQPVVVRRAGERFQLIAGERRLRAATKAGWTQVPAQVREADDRQVAELAIVENLQRKDLNAIEKAASFHQYLATYGCTQEDLAARLSIDRSTIANLIRLLELPEAVQDAVRFGSISAGHARALLTLGDEREQMDICQRIQEQSLSVRATEQLVQDIVRSADAEPLAVIDENGESHPVPRQPRSTSEQLASLEQELRAALGCKVQLTQTAKGRGKITIHFANHEEFARLRAHLSHHTQPQAHVA